jgi:sugar (pentulose or hexulose) kinase
MSFVLAIDLGSTGVRCGLVDHASTIRNVKYSPVRIVSPFPGN